MMTVPIPIKRYLSAFPSVDEGSGIRLWGLVWCVIRGLGGSLPPVFWGGAFCLSFEELRYCVFFSAAVVGG
jgi:hypothetical protein